MLKSLAVVLLSFAIARAEGLPIRKALVIGNDSYPGNPLQNAKNDATSIASALKTAGYATTLALDTDRLAMIRTLDQFDNTIQPGDSVIFYYAGHGLQVGGENYLVPIDFAVTTPDDVPNQGYSLSSLLGNMTSHGAVTQIIILDACRDNPFLGNRSMHGGWASFGTSAGTILAFGTSPGTTASDDPAQGHGMFTLSLLKYLTSSKLDVEEMLRVVRQEVIHDSWGRQVPWTSSSLIGTFHILPALDDPSLTKAMPLIRQDTDPPERETSPRSFQSATLSDHEYRDQPAARGPVTPELQSLVQEAASEVNQGQTEASVRTLQRGISLFPAISFLFRMLGIVLTIAGRNVEGEQAFDRAIELEPQDSTGYVGRCIAKALRGVPAATADCETAIRIDPRSARAHLALANCLFSDGQMPRAYSEVTQSIGISPDQSLAFALRGKIAASLGNESSARDDYQRAAQLATSAPETAQ